ncbi:MAG: MBL fold metallo-hydrolase, partial [Desulfovibrio sp.]|nr:MBL fold metallo-hydrolase [Desulfovibrio sp.]
VYNFYLGWFDGNPAHLHVLTPEASAKKYVEYMGGAKNVIKRAREDMARGEYRWVAQVLDHVVFADPSNKEARLLEADALEQLGYQAESGPWRNFYLSGAMDLRTMGATAKAPVGGAAGRAGMPADLYFGWLGIRLDSARAEGRNDRVLLKLGEEGTWVLELANSVLHAAKAKDGASADAGVTLEGSLPLVQGVLEGVLPLDKAKEKGLKISDEAKLASFAALFDKFSLTFNLVEP